MTLDRLLPLPGTRLAQWPRKEAGLRSCHMLRAVLLPGCKLESWGPSPASLGTEPQASGVYKTTQVGGEPLRSVPQHQPSQLLGVHDHDRGGAHTGAIPGAGNPLVVGWLLQPHSRPAASFPSSSPAPWAGKPSCQLLARPIVQQ